jgi:hypothetical protein
MAAFPQSGGAKTPRIACVKTKARSLIRNLYCAVYHIS